MVRFADKNMIISVRRVKRGSRRYGGCCLNGMDVQMMEYLIYGAFLWVFGGIFALVTFASLIDIMKNALNWTDVPIVILPGVISLIFIFLGALAFTQFFDATDPLLYEIH